MVADAAGVKAPESDGAEDGGAVTRAPLRKTKEAFDLGLARLRCAWEVGRFFLLFDSRYDKK